MSVTITIRTNGPLAIAADEVGAITLVDHEGNEIASRSGAPLLLCRCGGSSVKPFCDGTHATIGFIGAAVPRTAYDAAKAPT